MHPIINSSSISPVKAHELLRAKVQTTLAKLREIAPLGHQSATETAEYRDYLSRFIRLASRIRDFEREIQTFEKLNSIEQYIASQSKRLAEVLEHREISRLQDLLQEFVHHGISLNTFKIAFQELPSKDLKISLVIDAIEKKSLNISVSRIFIHFSDLIRQDDPCSICLENFTKREFTTLAVLDCHHFFHKKCLMQIKNSAKCPNCQKDPVSQIPSSDLAALYNMNSDYFEDQPIKRKRIPLVITNSSKPSQHAARSEDQIPAISAAQMIPQPEKDDLLRDDSDDKEIAQILQEEELRLWEERRQAKQAQEMNDRQLALELNGL